MKNMVLYINYIALAIDPFLGPCYCLLPIYIYIYTFPPIYIYI